MMGHVKPLALLLLLLAAPAMAADKPQFRALVFSKTAEFRHDAIPDGVATIKDLGDKNRFAVDDTEDAAAFTPDNLKRYKVVIFNNTTGDVLDAAQQAAFERYIRKGGGFAGIHAATDCEYDWSWYAGLVGAQFKSHPAMQKAIVSVEDRNHPSTKMLPAAWSVFDEWYNFRANPRSNVHVLASLDEASYENGAMGDHPIVWCHRYDGGRSWYTGLGHARESYQDPLFRAHLLGGIRWAAGVEKTPTPIKKTKPAPAPRG